MSNNTKMEMSNYPTIHHKQLLRQTEGTSSEESTRRKRRKTTPSLEQPEVVVNVTNSNSPSSDEFETVNLDKIPYDSDDSDDFEDVDLSATNENLTITIKPAEMEEEQKKKKRKVISLEERNRRVELHRMYILLMIVHGTIRNSWCNDKNLGNLLKISCVDETILKLINQDPNEKVITPVRSRRLLDGLKKIMQNYYINFRIISQGLIRKDWHELSIPQRKIKPVDQDTFKKFVQNFRGSRDLAAQGFLVLLRGVGLNARLVLSLQPPDYTIITPPSDSIDNQNHSEPKFKDSSFPIFWVEVWDKYSKKWISIDPIGLQTIEVCPKRRKSCFEPPISDPRNQLTYVIAFDKYGRVRDVTRRYSFAYNARTIRKRIEFRSQEDKDWYQKVLRACDLRKKSCTTDIFEMKEFHERDLAEGMPDNLQAFKNHPLYALESQLRQNEIIHPKDESSKCGTFRSKTSNKVIPVYKRSSVHRLRSAKAWYLKGRVLKVGAIPLKVKEAPDIENNIRLYAEFQTQMYIPPAIVDGKVPKNEFGNIDIYTKTMIPENGAFIPISDTHSIKLLIKAAYLIDIDFAKAIVAFDFGARRKRRPNVNAREGGIVIDKSYKEALMVTLDHLLEEEEAEKRMAIEASALHNWKYFLLKLRVQERLNRIHGKISDEIEEVHQDSAVKEATTGEFVADEEEEYDGGFMIAATKEKGELLGDNASIKFNTDNESEEEGGFLVEEDKLGDEKTEAAKDAKVAENRDKTDPDQSGVELYVSRSNKVISPETIEITSSEEEEQSDDQEVSDFVYSSQESDIEFEFSD
ncbi:uncharacterized protein SPAPADRAFT_72567 [Spathaspora passalidarum NRRL Y-27907]|uniref:DNA repair protein RAD4 n=1 Tax=Spathaspora passalidarum (strain NRRL Y-27907 / 11-Y1) TaxID=619300 RepID=G3AS15_SPAPN|nr:uncharacterized protein SPAPADRAFT_72567 [Spathaspora passalidarum NRRL Y-27907]EGW31864.1 hypothetical protein SPAPADRAFT_72567 [Spathaspora passalidarum NRRL Y-27907]